MQMSGSFLCRGVVHSFLDSFSYPCWVVLFFVLPLVVEV